MRKAFTPNALRVSLILTALAVGSLTLHLADQMPNWGSASASVSAD